MDFASETFIAAIQERAVSENPETGPDGIGVRTDGLAYTLEARERTQAIVTAFDETLITHPENRCRPEPGDPCHPLSASARPPAIAFHGSQDPDVSGDVTHPLGRDNGAEVCVAIPIQDATNVDKAQGGVGVGDPDAPMYTLQAGVQSGVAVAFRSDAGREGVASTPSADAAGRVRLRDAGFNVYEETAPTLDASAPHGVGYGTAVRRLTPLECERLQGLPDGYTAIPRGGGVAKDGPRYRALGNSFPVPVIRWIGERITTVDAALYQEATA